MIPDIIDDAEQELAVEKLFEIMENEITLTVPIHSYQIYIYLVRKKKKQTKGLNLLSSSSIDDLPIIIRFLIDGCNTDNATNVLSMTEAYELPSGYYKF